MKKNDDFYSVCEQKEHPRGGVSDNNSNTNNHSNNSNNNNSNNNNDY